MYNALHMQSTKNDFWHLGGGQIRLCYVGLESSKRMLQWKSNQQCRIMCGEVISKLGVARFFSLMVYIHYSPIHLCI